VSSFRGRAVRRNAPWLFESGGVFVFLSPIYPGAGVSDAGWYHLNHSLSLLPGWRRLQADDRRLRRPVCLSRLRPHRMPRTAGVRVYLLHLPDAVPTPCTPCICLMLYHAAERISNAWRRSWPLYRPSHRAAVVLPRCSVAHPGQRRNASDCQDRQRQREPWHAYVRRDGSKGLLPTLAQSCWAASDGTGGLGWSGG